MTLQSIKLGSVGKSVHGVEARLKKLGYLEGKVDQTFDKRTARAVVAFKKDNGWDNPKPVVHDEMVKALHLTDAFDDAAHPKKMKRGPDGGSDHNLITFTVSR